MAIPKNPESHSPIAQVSENEPTNLFGDITSELSEVWDEQTKLSMDDVKTGRQFKQEPQKREKLPPDSSLKPEKRMKRANNELNHKLSSDLLDRIMEKDWTFFERLVRDLLLGMGYGKAGYVTKKTGDGGIDVVIKQDELGFYQIYVQAKRWKPDLTVDKPEIQKFFGALSGENADKGLFITTAKFSKGAVEYAKQQRIVLVDGKRLTELMMEHKVGVSSVAQYEIKAIDSDFFSNEKA